MADDYVVLATLVIYEINDAIGEFWKKVKRAVFLGSNWTCFQMNDACTGRKIDHLRIGGVV